jgi:hypothetical protein
MASSMIRVMDSARLTLKQTSFVVCRGRSGAGVLARGNATAVINSCSFDRLDAAVDGGGVAAFELAEVSITSSNFKRCAADFGGGVFADASARVDITSSASAQQRSLVVVCQQLHQRVSTSSAQVSPSVQQI